MSKQTYKCNKDYFRTINTEDKAYWLGFIYADGCVTKNHRSLIINLSPTDIEHLNLFNQCIESTYPIKYKDNGRYVSLIISNKHFVENLIDKGCVPHKSLVLQFPTENQVPSNLIKHFIRGYFDGDGCIHTKMRQHKNKPRPYLECEVNFLGTYDMLCNIIKHVPLLNINIKEFGLIYKFRICSKNKIVELLDYLYGDSHFYLPRKYIKYINDIKNYNIQNVLQNPVTITEC
jgi:hypothetical protein